MLEIFLSFVKSFVVGGLICLIAQLIINKTNVDSVFTENIKTRKKHRQILLIIFFNIKLPSQTN